MKSILRVTISFIIILGVMCSMIYSYIDHNIYRLIFTSIFWVIVYLSELFLTNEDAKPDLLFVINMLFMMAYNGMYLILLMKIINADVFSSNKLLLVFIYYILPVYILVEYIKLYNKDVKKK